METTNDCDTSNPEPYEDMVRLNKLDPYETLIKTSLILKEEKKDIIQ